MCKLEPVTFSSTMATPVPIGRLLMTPTLSQDSPSYSSMQTYAIRDGGSFSRQVTPESHLSAMDGFDGVVVAPLPCDGWEPPSIEHQGVAPGSPEEACAPPKLASVVPVESPPTKTLAVDDAKTDEDIAAKRTCAVCLTNSVDTACLPCLHSALCHDCMAHVKEHGSRCPICRSRIDYVLHGSFKADYLDVAPFVLEAATKRVEKVRELAYNSMYAHVRSLLLLGVASAGAAIVSLLWLRHAVASLIFVGLAVVVGYVPWFLVTASALEADLGEDSSRASRFVSSEDCRSPCRAFVKFIVILLLAPLAAVSFFIPYAILVVFIRPVFTRCLPFMIEAVLRASVYLSRVVYMYVLRPLSVCASVMCWGGVTGLKKFGSCVHTSCVLPVQAAGSSCCAFQQLALEKLEEAFSKAWQCVQRYILQPICSVLLCILGGLVRGVGALGAICCKCISSLCRCMEALLDCMETGADFLYSRLIQPPARSIYGCGVSCLQGLARCVSKTAEVSLAGLTKAYKCLLEPIIRCCGTICLMLYNCIGMMFAVFGACIYSICCALGHFITVVLTCFFVRVLAPIARACVNCAKFIFAGISTAAACAWGSVTRYCLRPLQNCFRWFLGQLAATMSAILTAIYGGCLQPAAELRRCLAAGTKRASSVVAGLARDVMLWLRGIVSEVAASFSFRR
eukprot:TRINITY_DN49135_c0_g2_i1.p1 TRINITY_DN49135_c0_g2~~TRINITY_DN49135_c0_g2_i1.p1  ORF type:complete len:680 (-),score=33.60 TRINITY_DN49135_c0_g2_i1:129-2168(-)